MKRSSLRRHRAALLALLCTVAAIVVALLAADVSGWRSIIARDDIRTDQCRARQPEVYGRKLGFESAPQPPRGLVGIHRHIGRLDGSAPHLREVAEDEVVRSMLITYAP